MKVLIQEQLVVELGPRILTIAPASAIVPITDDGRVPGELGDEEAILLRWWSLSRPGFQRLVQETAGLRWIRTISTGVDHVLFHFLIESDIVLTDAPYFGALSPPARKLSGPLCGEPGPVRGRRATAQRGGQESRLLATACPTLWSRPHR